MPLPPDLTGQICVITGATSGIGRATAQALCEAGARLVLLARNQEKALAVKAELEASKPGAEISIHIADLASLAEIRRVAPAILADCPKIDVLLNNAGVVQLKRETTVDGYETTFAVNHLAYFLLTDLLLERVCQTPGARIVNVASEAHRFAKLDFDDLQSESSFASMRVYGTSKLANIFFTRSLAKRLADRDVTVNCLHPGAVSTGLGANNGWMFKIVAPLLKPFFRSPEKGAETSIHLCMSNEVEGQSGGYYSDKKLKTPSALATDDAAAERLWKVSEELVAVK